MPGIFISSYPGIHSPDGEFQKNLIRQMMSNDSYIIERNTLNKYMNDKLFFENEQLILLLDGVILNKNELCHVYGSKDFSKTVLKMREKNGYLFFNDFRGSFVGAVYEKAVDKWLFFTDHIGRSLFWFVDKGGFIVGSDLLYITKSLEKMQIKREVEPAAYEYMLTYGWMQDKRTCVKNVYRLMPGTCLHIQNGEFYEERYHRIDNKPNYSITEEQAIGGMNNLFDRAIKQIIEKDEEYGYRTVLDLSGGLDSRMICFAAKKLGVKAPILFGFGQSQCLDQKIAEQVAEYLKLPLLYYSLDSATHLYDIDQIIRMNSGSCYYSGIGATKCWMETLDSNSMGLSVNGIFGDVYEGGHLFDETDDGYLPIVINERKKCLSHLLPIELDEACTEGYDNIEIYLSYTRDMIGNMNTALTKRNFMETISPFSDVEFLSFFFSLPRKMRIEDKVGIKWMNRVYPAATQFKYAATNARPDASNLVIFANRIKYRMIRELAKLKGNKIAVSWSMAMNPFEYWYTRNPELRTFFETYFNENINKFSQSPDIQKAVSELYAKGTVLEKILALSALACAKQFND